jgi:hypothetical protein
MNIIVSYLEPIRESNRIFFVYKILKIHQMSIDNLLPEV